MAAVRGAVIHHPPPGKPHPQTHVHVLEVLAEAFVEGAHVRQGVASGKEEAAGEPVAVEGRLWVAAAIKVSIDDVRREAFQAESPRQDDRQRLKSPCRKGVPAVGVFDAAAGQAAVGVRVHEGDHPRQALRRRIESHVRVQQERVPRRGSSEDAVHVCGVREGARIVDDQGAGNDAAPPRDAGGRAVVDQDQSHGQAVGRGARDVSNGPISSCSRV